MEEPAYYSQYKTIVHVALPAILLNAAAPATLTIQTALLGQYGGSNMQAAFGAVATSANTTCFLFNFLVDGVSAKVGQSIGKADWKVVGQRVKMALACAGGAGALVALALACLQQPVIRFLGLQPAVIAEAVPYWWVRVALAPLVLLNMAISGILQGYNRVGVNATLSIAQSLLEIAGSALVLTWPAAPWRHSLRNMGCVSLASALLSALAGLVCIKILAPSEWRADTTSPAVACKASGLEDALLQRDDMETSLNLASQCTSMVEEEGSVAEHVAVESHLLDFVYDGMNMLVRSGLLQVTFFLALGVAGRLGTASLAAHQIIAQFWMLTSYVVDGFAVAGTVLGSRLAAQGPSDDALRHSRRLCRRLLMMGLGVGCATSLGFLTFERNLIDLFTTDPATKAVLHDKLWLVLCIAQPINALVFIYDGLIYAYQLFGFTRNAMLSGFLVAFCPALAITYWKLHALWGIWAAKGALNLWRLMAAAWKMHLQMLQNPGQFGHG